MPITKLLKKSSNLINLFRSSVPKKCQLCIDKDTNISFAKLSKLLDDHPDLEFFKANVYLKNNELRNKIYLDKNNIMQVPLEKNKYKTYSQKNLIKL
jgi:hypothetical protein